VSEVGTLTAYQVDPIEDPRWQRLLLRHPSASVFHSASWLKALHNAYGYEPIAITTTPPGRELENGMVFCRVNSWLTGNRLVSLPFSDHCEPLVGSPAEFDCLLARLRDDPRHRDAKYIEIRPMTSRVAVQAGFAKLSEFRLHRIKLAASADELFNHFHKNIQRNIRRAEALHLRYEKGATAVQLEYFSRLLAVTRRRHLLPLQPRIWFRSLLDCLGDQAVIRLAFKGDIPIAGILTLRHNQTMVYKYGCYDSRYRECRGMALLLWRSIQEACNDGVRQFDLGRSDIENAGLITFKERWGSTGSELNYWRWGVHPIPGAAWSLACLRKLVPYLPDSVVATAGRLLYRHVA